MQGEEVGNCVSFYHCEKRSGSSEGGKLSLTPGVEVSTHARLLPLLFDLWQGCVSSWGFEAKEEASGRQKMRAGHGHYIPFKSTPPT